MSTSNSIAIWGIMNEMMYLGSKEVEENLIVLICAKVRNNFIYHSKDFFGDRKAWNEFTWKILIVSSELISRRTRCCGPKEGWKNNMSHKVRFTSRISKNTKLHIWIRFYIKDISYHHVWWIKASSSRYLLHNRD